MTSLKHLLPVVLVFVLRAGIADAAGTWTFQTVDAGPYLGDYASLAVDSSGNPRVAYYFGSAVFFETGTLKYASRSGGVWTREPVDEGASTGQFCSLTLDASDNPMISYYDNFATERNLRFAWKIGPTWTLTSADTAGATGQYTTLARRPDGALSIAYFDVDGGNLRLARSQEAAFKPASAPPAPWTFTTIDQLGTVGQFTSMIFRPDGKEWISYYDGSLGDLVVANYREDFQTWQRVRVDTGGDVGRHTDLAADAYDYVHLSYYDVTNQALKYAATSATSWYTETVTADHDPGRASAISTAPNGNVEIAFRDGRGWIRLARKVAAFQWQFETIDSTGVAGLALDFHIDGSGRRHLVFYDEVQERLRYATAPADLPFVGVPLPDAENRRPFQLGAANPNPSVRGAMFPLSVRVPAEGRFEIFDAAGRLVARPWQGSLDPGSHLLTWDGRTEQGGVVSAGVYYYRVVLNGQAAGGRLVVTQ